MGGHALQPVTRDATFSLRSRVDHGDAAMEGAAVFSRDYPRLWRTALFIFGGNQTLGWLEKFIFNKISALCLLFLNDKALYIAATIPIWKRSGGC
jgi:hypothetical protein